MKELIEALQGMTDYWSRYATHDVSDKYENGINDHISEVLKKYSGEYKSIQTDYVRDGDYYECFVFAFIDNNDTLHLTTLEIDKD